MCLLNFTTHHATHFSTLFYFGGDLAVRSHHFQYIEHFLKGPRIFHPPLHYSTTALAVWQNVQNIRHLNCSFLGVTIFHYFAVWRWFGVWDVIGFFFLFQCSFFLIPLNEGKEGYSNSSNQTPNIVPIVLMRNKTGKRQMTITPSDIRKYFLHTSFFLPSSMNVWKMSARLVSLCASQYNRPRV